MKKSFIHIAFTLFTLGSFAQYSDCIDAKPFCTVTGEGEDAVFPGSGNVFNETALSCVDNENFSTWYTFSPTSNGIFNFKLNPLDPDDDYDWALFNITGHTCSDVPTDPSLLVSCNSWGSFGVNGATGIGNQYNGVGTSNGPGTTNGPPFNEDLNVQAGETYVLMVSNWSESNSGFNISVAGSTADGIVAQSGLSGFTDKEICLGDSMPNIDIDFTGSALGPITYSWSPNLFVNSNVQDPIGNGIPNQTTKFTLDFENGPCKYQKDLTVYVGSIDFNKEDKNQNVCIGEVSKLGIDFTGVELPSGLHYTWSPASLINSPGHPTPTTIPLQDTTTFYFHLENGPCELDDSLSVFVYNDTVEANFDYLINDDEYTIPIEVDFTNNSINQVYDYWFFGDGDSSEVRSPQQHEYPGYDTYEIILVVKSLSTFCVDTAKATIEFPEVEFPNIITPNEDGTNDLFTVTGLKQGTKLRIFNKWGKLVYKSEDYLHNWDAENAPDGMYFYEFIKPEGEKIKGWLQVIR